MDPRLRRHPSGFLQLAEMPTEEFLALYYSDEYYQTEGGSYQSHYSDAELNAIRLRIVQRRNRALELMGFEGNSLLDVGCGEGFVLASFAEVGWEVSGIDHSRFGVERMNPQVAHNVESGDIFTLISTLLSRGAKYDLLWLGNVLEHVLDPVGLLESLRKLVAPGGCLVVVVPNDGNVYHEDLLQNGDIPERFWIAIPDHINYFTSESLIAIATATGWRVGDLQGDFPIDVFLAHPDSNYVVDPKKGPAAHAARIRLEALIGAGGVQAANRFYSALAGVGLGRNLIAYLMREAECDPKEA